MRVHALLAILIGGATVVGCPSVPVDDDGDDDTASDVPQPLDQEYTVSGCLSSDASESRSDYCDHETLEWAYDASQQSLRVKNNRIYLNCEGERSMVVTEVGEGQFEILEHDEDTERYACMCLFEFEVTAFGIAEQVIQLDIERVVTDWPQCTGTVWSGTVDLSLGSGMIELDDDDLLGLANYLVVDECEAEGL